VSCERDSFAKGEKSILQRRKTECMGLSLKGKKIAAHMTRANVTLNRHRATTFDDKKPSFQPTAQLFWF
jgi:hypothetical protein